MGTLFLVVGAVVQLHGDHIILTAKPDELGDIEPNGRNAVLVFADRLSIQEKTPCLSHPVELEKDLIAVGVVGDFKMFTIPADTHHFFALITTAMADERAVGIRIVPGMRQADACPSRIVKIFRLGAGPVAKSKFPAWIEIISGTGRSGGLKNGPWIGRHA